MAQCFELTLLPGASAVAFEQFLRDEVFPKFRVLRRNVRGQENRLLKLDSADGCPRYIWLVFVHLVGSTPETAGAGPTQLATRLEWLEGISEAVKDHATVAAFTEVAAEKASAV
jgi:hypothetical protein